MTPFERLAAREFFGIKLGLDNITALTVALGHPERACPSIIVAGTNGKGSVAAITAHALHAAGHRVGLYTSPHLMALTERYRIAGQEISSTALAAALEAVFDAEAELLANGGLPAPATFFELTTAAAFVAFRAAGVEVAVLEVGLGGRFDATNVAASPIAAITSVGLDHTAQLGTTLEAIAAEKAGVIQPGATVISGVRAAAAVRVITDTARARGARLHDAHGEVRADVDRRGLDTWVTLQSPVRRYGPLPLALRGRHQVDNALVAVRLLETLGVIGLDVPATAVEAGLREAVWPARLQVVERRDAPLLVIDGAHNADGASALADWLDEVGLREVTLVTALMRDKDAVAVLGPLVRRARAAVALQVLPPRGLEANAVRETLSTLAPDLVVETAADATEALRIADRRGAPVVVAGSLFLAGAVLAALREQGQTP